MKLGFYTVANSKFVKGALPLMRSVKTYFPEATFSVISLGLSKKAEARLQNSGCLICEVPSHYKVPQSSDKAKRLLARFYPDNIDADYLIYIDSDAILSGRIPELLSVPEGKLGLVNESYLGYTIRDQFNDNISNEELAKYGVNPTFSSYNGGVMAAAKIDINTLAKQTEAFFLDKKINRSIHGNQALIALSLSKSNQYFPLPKKCNMIDEFWDGKTASVIHFAGWPRPWVTGKARPDNSYRAFKHWRKFSKINDFVDTEEMMLETYWRSLDDLRPMVRKLKRSFLSKN